MRGLMIATGAALLAASSVPACAEEAGGLRVFEVKPAS